MKEKTPELKLCIKELKHDLKVTLTRPEEQIFDTRLVRLQKQIKVSADPLHDAKTDIIKLSDLLKTNSKKKPLISIIISKIPDKFDLIKSLIESTTKEAFHNNSVIDEKLGLSAAHFITQYGSQDLI